MQVAIIDYGAGNLRSAARALEQVAEDASQVVVTSDPSVLNQSTHIVLPGVGAFGDCMRGLSAIDGMLLALHRQVIEQKKPFLGICVGMQMLFETGHEHGQHQGLGWLKGEVLPLQPGDVSLKIPHMGWNDLEIHATHPLLNGISTGDHAYFVHSYHAHCGAASDLLASVHYGQSVTAVVGQDNIMGTQFHPEKSQDTGLRLLKNFLAIQES
jgi:imidazole glycerol-phosphate synthase subunit HisH